ncbi:MAG TPA: VanW family protein [Candidatus Acidoferrum sp.]|nr:VanW family protein [Candidatus Acidoferrum sp.]
MEAKFVQIIACIVAASSVSAYTPMTIPPLYRGTPDEIAVVAEVAAETEEQVEENTSQNIEQAEGAEEPQETAEELPAVSLPLELGRATTGIFDYSKGRMNNIKLASRAINGCVVQPGGEFSFNKTVGPRTPKRGYKEAIIFVGKEKVKAYGGGICQLSTTIYQTALKAGMQITERHVHSLPVDYAKKGTDATVYYGSLDLRFVNTTAWPVQLSTLLDASGLSVAITAIEI